MFQLTATKAFLVAGVATVAVVTIAADAKAASLRVNVGGQRPFQHQGN